MSTPTLEQNFEQTLRELNSVIGQNANLREENAKLREALEEQLFAPNPSDERALALLDRKT